jgi:plastocyanin
MSNATQKTMLKAAALGGAAGLALTAQVLAQAASVSIENFKFGPETISAAANAPITWTNKDGAPHQVVIASKSLKTAVLQKDQSAQLTIAETGTYDYVCGIHGSMKGKIEIK